MPLVTILNSAAAAVCELFMFTAALTSWRYIPDPGRAAEERPVNRAWRRRRRRCARGDDVGGGLAAADATEGKTSVPCPDLISVGLFVPL